MPSLAGLGAVFREAETGPFPGGPRSRRRCRKGCSCWGETSHRGRTPVQPKTSSKSAKTPGKMRTSAALLPDACLFVGPTLLRLHDISARERPAEWVDNEKAHLRRGCRTASREKSNAPWRRSITASRTAASAAEKSPDAPCDGLCRRQGILRRIEWQKLNRLPLRGVTCRRTIIRRVPRACRPVQKRPQRHRMCRSGESRRRHGIPDGRPTPP